MKHNNTTDGYQISPGIYELNGATPVDGAVNFTITSTNATYCELVLFHREESEPYAVIPFPQEYRIGHVFSMMVHGLDIEEFEYAYRMDGPNCPEKGEIFNAKKYLLDPYAKAVVGQSEWGVKQQGENSYKARVVRQNFDWGKQKRPNLPMEELIIYELHVRGFTKDPSAKVKAPGTFAGLKEKIPYLKDLGVNAVEMMPIFEFDECKGHRAEDGTELLDYWGYNTVCFFSPNTRGRDASVNFLNCHDGFTLYDMYAYNQKHNEKNGWENTDGDNNNLSWNCGEEGETKDREVRKLRIRMMKNACAALMMSRGTPMLFSGDEFANTQFGNNNAYCQDNEIAWIDWTRKDTFREFHEFYRYMIHFRKENPVIYAEQESSVIGLPPMSTHKANPWDPDLSKEERGLGILYAGKLEDQTEDIVYAFFNTNWEQMQIQLPALTKGCWQLIVDTAYEESVLEGKEIYLTNGDYLLNPRSVMICKAVI